MAHPRAVRQYTPDDVHSYLPNQFQNFDHLSILCKRILKLYIRHRIETEWTTTKGMVKNAVKSWATWSENDQWGILKVCDEIKADLENLNSYSRVTDLINKLHTKAGDAYNEKSIKIISGSRLRIPTYFAIISVLVEMIKIKYPADYCKSINELLAKLQTVQKERKDLFDTRRDPTAKDNEIDALLTQLVLLGCHDIYSEAFIPGRNLFPYFERISSKNYFVKPTDIDTFTRWVEAQSLVGQRARILNDKELPNPNVPYGLMAFFIVIYLKNEPDPKKSFDEGLDYCMKLALRDPIIAPGNSFYNQYVNDPKTFDPKNDPSDASEIIQEEKSRAAKRTDDIDEDELLKRELQEKLALEAQALAEAQQKQTQQVQHTRENAPRRPLPSPKPKAATMADLGFSDERSPTPTGEDHSEADQSDEDKAELPPASPPAAVSKLGQFAPSPSATPTVSPAATPNLTK